MCLLWPMKECCDHQFHTEAIVLQTVGSSSTDRAFYCQRVKMHGPTCLPQPPPRVLCFSGGWSNWCAVQYMSHRAMERWCSSRDLRLKSSHETSVLKLSFQFVLDIPILIIKRRKILFFFSAVIIQSPPSYHCLWWSMKIGCCVRRMESCWWTLAGKLKVTEWYLLKWNLQTLLWRSLVTAREGESLRSFKVQKLLEFFKASDSC